MKALGMGFTLAITIFVCGMIGYHIGEEVSEFESGRGTYLRSVVRADRWPLSGIQDLWIKDKGHFMDVT